MSTFLDFLKYAIQIDNNDDREWHIEWGNRDDSPHNFTNFRSHPVAIQDKKGELFIRVELAAVERHGNTTKFNGASLSIQIRCAEDDCERLMAFVVFADKMLGRTEMRNVPDPEKWSNRGYVAKRIGSEDLRSFCRDCGYEYPSGEELEGAMAGWNYVSPPSLRRVVAIPYTLDRSGEIDTVNE